MKHFGSTGRRIAPAASWRGRALGLLAATIALAAAAPAVAAVPGEGRAWELITPADPVDATVAELLSMGAAGDRILYRSFGPMPGATSGDLAANNLGIRGTDGWQSDPLSFPYSIPKLDITTLVGTEVWGFDSQLSKFILRSFSPLLPGAPASPRFGIYRHQLGSAPVLLADLESAPEPRAISADTTRVAFSSDEHLLPSDTGRTLGQSIYELTPTGMRQVDVNSAGSLLSTCGSSLPSSSAMSRSGERIFFVHPTDPSCGTARVYMREGDETVEVSLSRCTRPDCNEPQDVEFAGVTPSGSVVFLATAQQLTDDDVNAKRDLYRFDVATEGLELVTPGTAAMEGEIYEHPVVSSDGSRAYLQAYGRLLPGEGVANELNLYFADEAGLHLIGAPMSPNNLQISRDGGVALISTFSAPEGTDTDGQLDVYRYDAGTDSLTRLSAGSSGGNGPFSAAFPGTGIEADHRAVSIDGQRAFFETAEPLIAEDHNEVADVYEWSGGQLHLVSSGEGADPAQLEGSSLDGGTVVFRSSASLLPRDRDGGDRDLYAARIGGGFDESSAPPETCGPCTAARASLRRPEPATAGAAAAKRGRLKLGRVGKDLAGEIVESGRASLELTVPAPGRVSAVARSRLAGKSTVVGRGVAGAVRPGRVRLSLTVARAARQALREGRELRFQILLRQPPLRLRRTLALELGGGK